MEITGVGMRLHVKTTRRFGNYTVCRGVDCCTPALSHGEAIRTSEIKTTWQEEKLYVRPVKDREPIS